MRRAKRSRGNLISQRRKLSSDARLIVALLNKQPQKINELCKRAGVHLSTFYRVRPLLEGKGIIRETAEGYVLWTYSEIEKIVVEAVNHWKSLAFRYPTIEEVAAEVAKTPEEARSLIYKTVDRTRWFPPNEGIVESAREMLGEVLVCASRMRDEKPSDWEEMYSDDPEILREAKRFLKDSPEMLPKLSENGMQVISWPTEALKYLGKEYRPKDRRTPSLRAAFKFG